MCALECFAKILLYYIFLSLITHFVLFGGGCCCLLAVLLVLWKYFCCLPKNGFLIFRGSFLTCHSSQLHLNQLAHPIFLRVGFQKAVLFKRSTKHVASFSCVARGSNVNADLFDGPPSQQWGGHVPLWPTSAVLLIHYCVVQFVYFNGSERFCDGGRRILKIRRIWFVDQKNFGDFQS